MQGQSQKVETGDGKKVKVQRLEVRNARSELKGQNLGRKKVKVQRLEVRHARKELKGRN
jgi:hypothetical protein